MAHNTTWQNVGLWHGASLGGYEGGNEWAILHANLLSRLKAETETLLREIEAESAKIS